jgi:hypothetical protein
MNRVARTLVLVMAVLPLGADRPLIDDYVKATVGPIPSGLRVDPFYKKRADC